MANTSSYQIRLPQFEGPFDLLLFFIERDELDIYNIPITRITQDFLDFLHASEERNIELSSEFILFISTLMRIKAKMLLPRKELDEQGNEIDPRQELVDKILEYKKFGEESSEGTEIQAITLFKLMKVFEKVMKRMYDRNNKPQHVVYRYNYTMEDSREYMLTTLSKEKNMSFEKVFDTCQDRIHAIFLFLTILELAQQNYLSVMVGEGRNNFIISYNEEREPDVEIPLEDM
jgi:segregation and condensation protein A